MSDSVSLERGYRRLLACYPRAFRRENEQEILAVLMACAQDGQRRPGLAASADLIKGALKIRLRPASRRPRSVIAGVRLMCAGAVLELAALVTIVVTTASVRAAVLRADPGFTAAQWHGVLIHLTIDEVAAPIVIGVWLWLAWANNRGYDWARLVFIAFFALITVSLISALAAGAAVYATADLIAGATIWGVALAAMVLILTPRSGLFYQHESARPEPAQR